MRKLTRCLILALALALLLSASAIGETVYPVEGADGITLTYALVSRSSITSQYPSHLDTPLMQAWLERTGVSIETLEVNDDTAMNLVFASGELPDMVQWTWGSYTGGISKAVADGIVRPVNDLLDEYAPEYKAVLESTEEFRRGSKTSAGDIPGFFFLRESSYLCTYGGPMVRADWLEKCGLENPRTLSDFYNMLVAFRDQCGAEYPLSVTPSNMVSSGSGSWLVGAFGIASTDFYHDGETVKYGYYTPELKEAYAYLHQLYEEGLLDPNFATLDTNTHNSNLYNGKCGVTVGNAGGTMGPHLHAMQDDPEFDLAAMRYLVADDAEPGAKSPAGMSEFPVTNSIVCITTACEHPELAAQFLNYGYTEEGRMLMNFGVEGESYEMIDGYPTYTETIMNNPDGISTAARISVYTFASYMGPTLQMEEYIEQYMELPQQRAAIDTWLETDFLDHRMPNVSIPEDQASRYASLLADISTYCKEMRIKFVSGEESLDNYDAYLEQLNSMGVEELIAIQQAAYDEYMSR